MPQPYSTKLNEAFASAPLKVFYQNSVADAIVNRDYEGEIKGKGTKVNILSFSKLSWQDYTGANVSPQSLNEIAGVLVTDQQKTYYFTVKDIEQLKSFVKNPQGTVIEQLGNELKKIVDTKALGMYGDVASGNRVGTDYTTGTVAIDVAGNVTGTSTTFTSSMVGLGFKAAGHTKWYRVKTFTSATVIVIENDSDDEASSYDGGVISAGASYTIEAATKLQVTKSNIYAQILALKEKLNTVEIPAEDRSIVVPTKIGNLLRQAPELIPAVPTAYDEVVRRGLIGTIAGFTIYESERVAGDNTNGYHIIAMHKSWLTMAEALVEAEEEPFVAGNFGRGYKGLFVYGLKVADERRKAAAELFCYV